MLSVGRPRIGRIAIRARTVRSLDSSTRKRTTGSFGARTRAGTANLATVGRDVDAAPNDVPPPDAAGGYVVPPEAPEAAGARRPKSRVAIAKVRRMSTRRSTESPANCSFQWRDVE